MIQSVEKYEASLRSEFACPFLRPLTNRGIPRDLACMELFRDFSYGIKTGYCEVLEPVC